MGVLVKGKITGRSRGCIHASSTVVRNYIGKKKKGKEERRENKKETKKTNREKERVEKIKKRGVKKKEKGTRKRREK